MMADQVRLLAADLETHASHVDGVAGSVATAQDAGNTVRLDTGAYGKLCVLVPPLLDLLQDRIIDAMQTAAGSLGETAGRVRATAVDYRETDGGNADEINGVGQESG